MLGGPERGWRCSSCDPTIAKGQKGNPNSNDPELRLDDDEKRLARNCEKETSELGFFWMPSLKRCPKSQIKEREIEIAIRWWGDWKRYGALPFNGSILDQPGVVYDSIDFCEDTYLKVQNELQAMELRRFDKVR